MKRITVLGAAGYIGSTICDLLLRNNYIVNAIDNGFKGNFDPLMPLVFNNNFDFNFGDVTSPADMEKLLDGSDIIINLASLVGFPICKKYPALARITAVDGMKNVLRYRPNNCPVLFSSTGSVYGEVLDGVATEETIPQPLSVYGQVKLETEKICLEYDNTLIYRFATLFGVGFATTRVNLLLNTFVWETVTNKSLVVFQGGFKRNFIHIRDICNFILHTIENYDNMYSKYRLYNVGNESLNYSKKELCEEIAKQVDYHLVLAETHVDEDGRNYTFSSKRAYESGWRPTINIQSGIKELVKATKVMTPWTKYN